MINITKEFLEVVLGQEISAFEVSPGSNIGDGYTSVLVSIDVTLADPTEKRKHLLLKCYPSNPARQGFLSEANIFKKELLVYSSFIPELIRFQLENRSKSQTFYGPPFPPFFYGRAIDYSIFPEGATKTCSNPLDNCLIMADIRKTAGFKLANRFLGFDLDHCKLVISAQAKLHALSWAYKNVTQTPCLAKKFDFLGTSLLDGLASEVFEQVCNSHLVLFEKAIKNSAIDEEKKVECLKSLERYKPLHVDLMLLYCSHKQPKNSSLTRDNALRICPPVVEDEEPWLVMTHGDAWLNNMLFRYDDVSGKPLEVIFVDLQLAVEADPFIDVAYNFYTSTPAELRQEHLDDLLKLYYETFLEICDDFQVPPLPGFSLSEVKRRFHRTKVFGFTMAVMTMPIFLSEVSSTVDLDKEEGNEKGMEGMIEAFMSISKALEKNPNFIKRASELVVELHDEGII